MSNEHQSAEYEDLSSNMRHYANMRFAQLTLYFAFTGGLATGVFIVNPPLSDCLRLTFTLIGVLGSAAFGVMEERARSYWDGFCRRAVCIEASLDYKQYTNRQRARIFSATNAARIMVWGGIPLWIAAAIWAV